MVFIIPLSRRVAANGLARVPALRGADSRAHIATTTANMVSSN